MGKEIAVEGCTIEDTTGGGTVTISSPASTSVKINDSGVYFGTINIAVAGSDGGGSITDNNGMGTGTISGTASAIKSGSNKALLKDDSASITVTGTAGGNPVPSVSVTVKVTDAGQSDVVAL